MTEQQKKIIINELNLGMQECDTLKDYHINLSGKNGELKAYFMQLCSIRAHFGFALQALKEFENDNSSEERDDQTTSDS